MSEARLRLVVDASVGIKLFINETDSDKVQTLFSKLNDDPPAVFYVPDLFYIECANILVKTMRRYGRCLEDSKADLADLQFLGFKSTPTVELMEEALNLAVEKGLTAYDACYAVLARRLEIPLVTADLQLVRSIDWAVWLGDFKV